MAYDPAPGKQDPGKYQGQVGPNYQKYGEQTGYIYYPPQDKYYTDPTYAKKYGQLNGYIPPDPKKPSLTDTLLPVGGVLAAAEIGKAGGKAIPDLLSKGFGMFGTGSSATPEVSQLAASAPEVASGGLQSAVPAGFYGEAAPEATGMFGVGALPAAGIGAGVYLGGKALYDEFKGKKPGLLGRGTLDIATGGLNELALATGLLGHKSTREYTKDNTNNLLSQGKDNPDWQNYVSGIRAQYDSGAPDPSHPFDAGKYSSFGEYKAAGLDPKDLSGVYGNLNVYGPDWIKYTPDQQLAITQANINSGIYDSKKGDVVITDEATAKKNRDAVLAGSLKPDIYTPPPSVTAAPPTPPNTDPNLAPPLQTVAPNTTPVTAPVNDPNSPGFRNGVRQGMFGARY